MTRGFLEAGRALPRARDVNDWFALYESRSRNDAADRTDSGHAGLDEDAFHLGAAPFCVREEMAFIAADETPETDLVNGAEERSCIRVVRDDASGSSAEPLKARYEIDREGIQSDQERPNDTGPR